ncbi:MAG: hypothetical protein PVSMB1_18700 [Gemmatimonadaceae bacterium]
MRRQFSAELQRIVARWNVELEKLGVDFALQLPSQRFHRTYGPCAGLPFDVDGTLIAAGADAKIASRFPTAGEFAAVRAVMQRELTPDCVASWIAPASARGGEAGAGRQTQVATE